jgi:hypothetical protein
MEAREEEPVKRGRGRPKKIIFIIMKCHDNRHHPEMSNQQHTDKQNTISQKHQESINNLAQSGHTSGDRDDKK